MTEFESNAALEKVLDEIRNINHDVLQSFIFQNDKIIAKDKFVSARETSEIIQAFEEISNRASVIEGVESITIQASNGRLDINHINDFYVVTVTSKEANPETIDNLTHVLIPGIFKIIQTVTPSASSPSQYSETIKPSLAEEQEIKSISSPGLGLPQFLKARSSALEYTEFTVEDVGALGALSSSADTVRLDAITFGRWTEIFGENAFNVSLKVANNGKTILCKSELSKDSKHQRGAVFLPELIQRKLNVEKGSKILVKPVINQSLKMNLEDERAEQTKVALKQAFDQNNITSSPKTIYPFETNSPITEYSEFTVDDTSKFGIISGTNTIKLHTIAVGRWVETYGSNKIQNVVLKDRKSGKTIECKCESSKDPEHDKNSVRIPEPLRLKLQIKKGSKVLIKPIIKNEPYSKESVSEHSKRQPEADSEKPQSSKPNINGPSEEQLTTKHLFLHDSPNCQLMVEGVSGLSGLRESDIVRFDKALVMRWKELYGERKIEKVLVSNPNLGKSVKIKFKIVGGSKFEGKGLIQIPKSIQNQLSVKEGLLVVVKPILE